MVNKTQLNFLKPVKIAYKPQIYAGAKIDFRVLQAAYNGGVFGRRDMNASEWGREGTG